MRLQYERMEAWPPLAWLAECRTSDSTLRVLHGPMVEIRDDWFCEAVWDGPFEAGAFDQTDLVFGSGGRSRGAQVTFVSSGTTVDRLHALEVDGMTRVSNSLPCLLAVAGAQADPTYPPYHRDLRSIIYGLDEYKAILPVATRSVRLTYFSNLAWDGATLSELEKPGGPRAFDGFVGYRKFLSTALGGCLANAADDSRMQSFRALGTLSSGYDSPTVATLGREHGLREVLSFTGARDGQLEDGRPIAAALGLKIALVPRDAWRSKPLAEVPFLIADGRGEDVYFSGAEELLRGRVLLTGFHGDKIWGKYVKPKLLTPRIKRGDQSGLTLTEYRLWAGFIHLPVPFMGVRQICDIHAISNASEMRPWDVAGTYSRPICRRIVEEAGVPRGAFGVRKKAASVFFSGGDLAFLSETSADHAQWSRTRRDTWLAGGRLPPHLRDRGLEGLVVPYNLLMDGLTVMARGSRRLSPAGAAWLEAKVDKRRWIVLRHLRDRGWYASMFPWAVERAKERYRIDAGESEVGGEPLSSRMTRPDIGNAVPGIAPR